MGQWRPVAGHARGTDVGRGVKLYLAVLDDLTPGERIAQAAHAVTEMAVGNCEAFRRWHSGSNTLVVVTMDAGALERLLVTAMAHGDAVVEFREPDRGMERTAIAVFPTEGTRRLLRRARLA